MTDPDQHGTDGYGPPPSEAVAQVRDEFFGWPRDIQDPDQKPTKSKPRQG